MSDSLNVDSASVEISEELIKEVDSSGVPTIEERAQKVFKFLKGTQFTTWDITCFAIQYVGSIALAHPILLTSSRVINRWLYICHYVNKGFKEESK